MFLQSEKQASVAKALALQLFHSPHTPHSDVQLTTPRHRMTVGRATVPEFVAQLETGGLTHLARAFRTVDKGEQSLKKSKRFPNANDETEFRMKQRILSDLATAATHNPSLFISNPGSERLFSSLLTFYDCLAMGNLSSCAQRAQVLKNRGFRLTPFLEASYNGNLTERLSVTTN